LKLFVANVHKYQPCILFCLRNETKLAHSSRGRERELGEALFECRYRYTVTKQVKCQKNARGKNKKKMLIGQGKRK